MTTIKIKKTELIKAIASVAEHFGSADWDVFVDVDGAVDARHNTEINAEWDEFVDLYTLGYTDENDNCPGDDEYDAKGMAEWIVDEGDAIPSHIDRLNAETGEFETVEIELI